MSKFKLLSRIIFSQEFARNVSYFSDLNKKYNPEMFICNVSIRTIHLDCRVKKTFSVISLTLAFHVYSGWRESLRGTSIYFPITGRARKPMPNPRLNWVSRLGYATWALSSGERFPPGLRWTVSIIGPVSTTGTWSISGPARPSPPEVLSVSWFMRVTDHFPSLPCLLVTFCRWFLVHYSPC